MFKTIKTQSNYDTKIIHNFFQTIGFKSYWFFIYSTFLFIHCQNELYVIFQSICFKKKKKISGKKYKSWFRLLNN